MGEDIVERASRRPGECRAANHVGPGSGESPQSPSYGYVSATSSTLSRTGSLWGRTRDLARAPADRFLDHQRRDSHGWGIPRPDPQPNGASWWRRVLRRLREGTRVHRVVRTPRPRSGCPTAHPETQQLHRGRVIEGGQRPSLLTNVQVLATRLEDCPWCGQRNLLVIVTSRATLSRCLRCSGEIALVAPRGSSSSTQVYRPDVDRSVRRNRTCATGATIRRQCSDRRGRTPGTSSGRHCVPHSTPACARGLSMVLVLRH